MTHSFPTRRSSDRPAAFPEIRQILSGALTKARDHPFHRPARHGRGVARLASEPVEAVDRDQPGAIRRQRFQPEERAKRMADRNERSFVVAELPSLPEIAEIRRVAAQRRDRKSTRLNYSH